MTEALSRHAPQGHPFVPDDDTPVLVHRELRPGIDPASISRFGDNRWHLSPAVHEDHYRSFSLNFAAGPGRIPAHRQGVCVDGVEPRPRSG